MSLPGYDKALIESGEDQGRPRPDEPAEKESEFDDRGEVLI